MDEGTIVMRKVEKGVGSPVYHECIPFVKHAWFWAGKILLANANQNKACS